MLCSESVLSSRYRHSAAKDHYEHPTRENVSLEFPLAETDPEEYT